MNVMFRCVVAIVMVCGIAEAEPPRLVAERFQLAQESLDSGQFVGSYTMKISSVVAKEDGSAKKATEVEFAVEVDAGGVERRHLTRFIVDGEDRTEKHREKLESGSDDGDGDEGEGEDFLIPFGADSGRFTFGPAVAAGGHVEMTFSPSRGHKGDTGITSGSMAWNEANNDPMWLELDVLEPPKPLRGLKVRMEFLRVGDEIFMNRMVSDGRVKVLLMKRNFHMEMTLSDVDSR